MNNLRPPTDMVWGMLRREQTENTAISVIE